MATADRVGTKSANEARRLAAVRRYDILDTPPDGAFDRVCALAARFFDTPIATVTIVDEDRIWFKATQGLDVAQIARQPGLCASAILQDGPYIVSDGLTDPRTAANGLVHGELGVRFYAAAPITTSDGYRLGTINVIDTNPREVGEQDAQTLIDLAAIVMDELELRLAALREIQAERSGRLEAIRQKGRVEQLAATLQRSLSPPLLPDVPGLETAVYYRPYSEDGVGGDFYDLFPLGGGRWGFFLGDVCGKGPEAASLTSLARYTLRTAAMLSESPAATLCDLNSALRIEPTGEKPMCTAVYGELSTGGGDTIALELAVAGHPAPIILRAGSAPEFVAQRGPVLGAFDDVEFETCSVRLEPKDLLLLYTDGILETRLAGALIEERQLAELLSRPPASSARELVGRVGEILNRLDEQLRDDVAVMALGGPARRSA